MGTLTIATLPFTVQTTDQLPPFPIGSQVTGDYTFQLADAQVIIPFNTAVGQIATIPPGIFAVGTQLTGVQMGLGALTFAAGAGVTLLPNTPIIAAGQFSMMGVLQMSLNTWVALGSFLFTAP
jgi:hypothetical protein